MGKSTGEGERGPASLQPALSEPLKTQLPLRCGSDRGEAHPSLGPGVLVTPHRCGKQCRPASQAFALLASLSSTVRSPSEVQKVLQARTFFCREYIGLRAFVPDMDLYHIWNFFERVSEFLAQHHGCQIHGLPLQ